MPKGHTNNKNGRPKGKPNRSTKEFREMLTNAFEGTISKIPLQIEKMEFEQQLELLVKFLPYLLPKPTEQPENDYQRMQPPNITIVRRDMSGGHSP